MRPIGRVRDLPDAGPRYVAHLLASTPQPLAGLRVVVDCAYGAASTVAPDCYARAGAEVVALHADPDGLNINDGVGSTHLGPLRAAVRAHGADLGIAHDGDADRCLAVDADGRDVDGDQIMAVLALAMHEAGELVDDTLVATVMSNLGLHLAMREHGITVRTTQVGDRYVLEELRAGGFALGGEQSGHVVLPAYATTGDGLLTALRVMARMAQTGKSLADLAGVVTVLPQVLENVRVADKDAVAASPAVQRGGGRRRGAPRRHRPGAAAAVGHRAAGAGDGRGADDRRGPRRRRRAERGRRGELIEPISPERPRRRCPAGAPSSGAPPTCTSTPPHCGPPGAPPRRCAPRCGRARWIPADLAAARRGARRRGAGRRARPAGRRRRAGRPASSPSWTSRSGPPWPGWRRPSRTRCGR